MSILERFTTIMKSNINALLDKAEDPAKMVDQMLLDMREDFAEVRKETAGVMAREKAAQRELDECKAAIERYDRTSKAALRANEEGDARQLVAKKLRYESQLPSLQTAYDVAHTNAEKMRDMHDKLKADIESLDARRAAIKAKAAAAKAQEHVNDIVAGGPDMGSSMEAFERLEDKVDARLDAATAEAELVGDVSDDDVAAKYESDGEANVDAELARMKAELGL